LEGESKLDVTMFENDEKTLLDNAHSLIVVSLGDKEKTTMGLRIKFESLCMTKSLVNGLYLKQVLYSYKMSSENTISKQLDKFNKLIIDLENIDA